MSERLTSLSHHKSSSSWTQLVLPLMLLLSSIALIALDMDKDSYALDLPIVQLIPLDPFPINALIFLTLVTLSGFLIRNLLPAKSSESLKAFAAACGIGVPFIFLQGHLPFMDDPMMNFVGSSLMVSSWVFLLYGKDKSLIWSVASGITAGLACSASPVCLSGVLPLFFFSFTYSSLGLKYKTINFLTWLGAFVCGLVPTLSLASPFEAYQFNRFNAEVFRGTLDFLMGNAPIWSWIFVLVGLVVAIMQRQTILLGLIIPLLVLRLVFAGFMPADFWGPGSTLLLPFAWLTSYGMLRVLRGIEQGVRNVNSKQAKWIPVVGTGVFVFGFSLKLISLFYFVA